MNNIMIFENKQVEVFELNGQVLFNPKHVAYCLGISDVNSAIRNFNNKQVIKLKNSDMHSKHIQNSNVGNIDFRKLNNAGENFLTESGVYKLIFKSRKEEAERFQDWVTDEVLPTLRKTGTYSIQQTNVPFKEQVEATDFIANSLNVNEASKIVMFRKVYEDNNVPCSFLPDYIESNGKELRSATELLRKFNLGMTVVEFNKLLVKKGYLEERSRPSSKTKSGVKKYKIFTEKGLGFGENMVNTHNQKEPQPQYYVDKFLELYKLVV